MKHISIFILFIVSLFASASALAGTTVTLKNKPVVQGENITFGDIFNNAGEKDDYVIAAAPVPGKTITFKASSVAFVARKHGLNWQPARAISQITVLRQGHRIPRQHIQELVRSTLELELQSDQFELVMSSRQPDIQVALDQAPEAMIESLTYSQSQNGFTAVILAPADAATPNRYRISGKFYRQELVPVTTKLIRAGEKINEQDVEYKLVRSNKIGRNVVLDIGEIIDRSPRRTLRTGSTFSLNNLGAPVTVGKGKRVAVIYKNNGIALTMTGRTLEKGSEGDIIRVENIHSRKIIQAEVLNSQEVRIITAQQRLAAIQ